MWLPTLRNGDISQTFSTTALTVESTLEDGRSALAFALAAWESTELGRIVLINEVSV